MQNRGELAATSGAQLLALSFKALMPLLGHLPSSTSRGKFGLLDSRHILETSYLRHQSLDLRPSLHLLVGQLLPRSLGGLQLPTQALHLGLRRGLMAVVGGTSCLHLKSQAQELGLLHQSLH